MIEPTATTGVGTARVSRVDHVGLSVADLAAMKDWYAGAFGFDVEFVGRVEEIDLDVVMLKHPERGDRLELLHRGGSSSGPKPADPAGAALSEGFGHMAFDVDGVDKTFRRLLELGALPVMPPRPSPEPGVRMAFVADPEGNLVEILDRGGIG
jgi:catechol 2,3-dioxygenase-like lactoylglutathione lyase family enzyme